MLTDIEIHHFALIDHLELSLAPGMTVITGETGAGKSIMIDAMEIALGERSNAKLIANEAEKAEIHLHFNISQIKSAKLWLEKHDIDSNDDCFIRRVLFRDGRSKSYINQVPVTLPLLREFSEMLISIHGQHGFHHLLKTHQQRKLVDDYGDLNLLVNEVNTIYFHLRENQKKQIELKETAQKTNERLDYLSFQLNELESANFTEEELSSLEQQQKKLAHADRLIQDSQQAFSLLSEEDHAIYKSLNQVSHLLAPIKNLHPSLETAFDLTEQASLLSKEAINEIQTCLNQIEIDPEKLAEIETRLSEAHQLARKHRISIEELPALTFKFKHELNQLGQTDEELIKLQTEESELIKQYNEKSLILSASRKNVAKTLSLEISKHLRELAMPNGELLITLVKHEDNQPHEYGMEKIQFLVTTNPGQPPQPLQNVVSGGELSRISLAIQVIAASKNETATLIFDEVDVGISGATADIVGALLRELGEKTQVLCVTHLAQVAAKGHHHLKVEKIQTKDQTKTALFTLKETARIHEIARMSGGIDINEHTLAHARALLAPQQIEQT